VLHRASIVGSRLSSVRHKIHSIPIEHSPPSSKSSYRKCPGGRHSTTPENIGAGAFPIKPKEFRGVWWCEGGLSTRIRRYQRRSSGFGLVVVLPAMR
jgi:hypothetical protein